MTGLLEDLKKALASRYTIDREVGSGGMATVYLAKDMRHRRDVAVKVLRPELAAALGGERFLREIEIAAGLQHPHILPLYDSGEAEGFLYYVMPFVDGESLRDRITRQGELPISEAVRLLRDVVDALAHAHERKVIHRDIKPENVLLSGRHALVADFGVAKAVSEATGRHDLTTAGVALGTPAYMSPEQATADPDIDHRTDLYAVGVLGYELLAGQPPFTGTTAQMILASHVTQTPAPVTTHRTSVSPALAHVVMKCLEKRPADRWETAEQLLDQLETMSTPSGGVRGTTASPVAAEQTPAAGPAGPGDKSIAVFPFTNMSADAENEYLSDGITEELIGALSKLPTLQVASRTSSFALKGKGLDVREIGEKLGVASVLEGSVRKAGHRLRIAAQLTDVTNGYNLWSEVYDRELEDVFAIQDEISRSIVDALKVKLMGKSSEPIVMPATENLEAYTLYLKGRFFRNKFTEPDLRISLEFYKQALENDNKYARAYAGIADTWMNLADDWLPPHEAYPRSKEAAEQAVNLEPTLDEAHTSLGKILGWYEWDFAGAERELREVIEQAGQYADAHFSLGSILPTLGRIDEAVEEMRKAVELDPLLDMHRRWLARLLVFGGNYDEAIIQSRKTLEINPNYSRAYLEMGHAYLGLGKTEEALAAYRQGHAVEGGVVSFNASTAKALAAMGRKEEVQRVLTELEAQSEHRYIRAEVIGAGYAALGEIDKAFHWLDKALEARSAGLIYLGADPAYEQLRSDQRFAELLKQIGLPH